MPSTPDPILVRRARIARLTELGQQVGYGMFGLAIAAFVYAAITSFVPWVVTLIIVALAVGTATLAPAIVFGYAVKAAEREDRARPS
jgi:hypothetical protein